jgi:hypothetical protein
MKKFLFAAFALMGAYSATSQTFGLGVSGGYLTEIESIGVSGDVVYEFNDSFGIATTATFTFTEESGVRTKWFALDLNGRYKLVEELYVLAGGQYLDVTVKQLGLGGGVIGDASTSSDSEFGINAGAGYKYNLVDNVNLFTEVKYVFLDAGYLHARLGLQFDF